MFFLLFFLNFFLMIYPCTLF